MKDFTFGKPYIFKAEGELSRAKTDTASKNPAPYIYKGKTGWHTNKGVTWSAFKNLAPILGYEANATNFFTMPDIVWNKIFNHFGKSIGADKVKSDVIALALLDWAWASGDGMARLWINRLFKKHFGVNVKTNAQIVAFINAQEEHSFFQKFVDIRKEHFATLMKSPKYAANKGWLTRMDDLRKFGVDFLKKKVNIKHFFKRNSSNFLRVFIKKPTK